MEQAVAKLLLFPQISIGVNIHAGVSPGSVRMGLRWSCAPAAHLRGAADP